MSSEKQIINTHATFHMSFALAFYYYKQNYIYILRFKRLFSNNKVQMNSTLQQNCNKNNNNNNSNNTTATTDHK